MANASQTRLAYVAESTYGVTPATPTFQKLRYTAEGLGANIENVTSNEIRADRNVSDLIQVGSSAGGNVDFELSYGSYDDFLESLMFSTFSTNVLKNGVTEKSFTLEKTFETGATDQFHRFTGAIANGFNLSMTTGAIVTGSFDFVAQGGTSGQSIITGATYDDGNSNPVINAATDFASLAITGATSPKLTALDLSITNNLTPEAVLGSIESRAMTAGRFQATGNLTAYFDNEELYEMFLAGTATDLEFKLGGASSKNYLFNLPKIKFNSAQIVAGGNDQPILATIAFTGLYDGTDDATLKITRTT
jgi:hypothetical protein